MTMGFFLPQSPQAISDLCRIPHPEQHQSGKTNPRHSILTGIWISPEMWGVGLCDWAGCLGSAPKNPPKLVPTERGHQRPPPSPCSPGMTFKQVGAGWIYILLQKKRGKYIHEGRTGWTIIIWKQVSTIVTHSSQQPGASRLSRLALWARPGLASWKPLGSWGRWKQWDHTQGECVGHSFCFKGWNAPAGGRGVVNSY